MTRIHLSIMQPPGYVHSQGFLDQARYARYQFRRLGAEVSIGKNRLRSDAVNIIFGAHLGFQDLLKDRYTCIFFNLEQLGHGGAQVSQSYIDLLTSSEVIDYDFGNLDVYNGRARSTPIVRFLFAPYLANERPLAIPERPIDLLFFGSLNDRRLKLIERVEACGWNVARFDHPLYGAERDQFILQAKAIFNCHFYESSRFEQARVFHSLSLGTPVISERRMQTTPPEEFEDSVSWFTEEELERFFNEKFMTSAWQCLASQQLARFANTDPLPFWTSAYDHARRFAACSSERKKSTRVWRPTQMNLGAGKDYKTGWFNVDILPQAEPDAILNLAQHQTWPIKIEDPSTGRIELSESCLEFIYANNVLEHVPDLPTLMGNCLTLLREGGRMTVEVPYERASSAWQDPTHVRAMNENSWVYYEGWFWYLGWFKYRFQVEELVFLDRNLTVCNKDTAHFMRVTLSKQATTLKERTIARTMQANFGGLPDDLEVTAPIRSESSIC